MKRSLARRLFLAMVGIGLVNIILALVAAEMFFEQIEQADLEVALAKEKEFFIGKISGQTPQQWETSLLKVYYLPNSLRHEPSETSRLPAFVRDQPVPFAREIEHGDQTFLALAEAVPYRDGVIYLTQDISVIEDQEGLLQKIGYTMFTLLMIAVCLLLAFFGARYIIRPLKQLTAQIRTISPERYLEPIRAPFRDRELEDIRTTLNDLLEALNAHVQREKSLVSMASHELRTPVAVIAGALDVLEQRNNLGSDDQRTLARVRQATRKMQTDISALLNLARHGPDSASGTDDPSALIHTVIQELEQSNPDFHDRILRLPDEEPAALKADPALLHMLIRNLLQNALRHTSGPVSVRQRGPIIEIGDTGPGLPQNTLKVLNGAKTQHPPEDGLGLYIVRLLSERLGCELNVVPQSPVGTLIRVRCPTA